jgi:hypothetical protein
MFKLLTRSTLRNGFSVYDSFCNQLTHGFQSSMRSNDGFAPCFGTFLGRLHRITGLFCFPCFTAFATSEQSVELFVDKRREKILRRNRVALQVLAGIAELAKQMIRLLRQID